MRGKGVQNKNKDRLWKALQQEYGDDFNPIIKMAELATKIHLEASKKGADTNVIKAAVDAWDKIAQYVTPKLKAVEVSGEIISRVKEMEDGVLEEEISNLVSEWEAPEQRSKTIPH